MEKLTHGTLVVGQLKDKLFIADQSRGKFTPGRLSAYVRAIKRKVGKVDLVCIDYLQLMNSDSKTESRLVEVSEISRSIKLLGQEHGCPVIALSQLSRACEARVNKRPIMSDLRESGAIEQDADGVMFIYRDEVYNEQSPDKGIAEIIIGKNRHGETGTVRMAFIGAQTRFANIQYSNVHYLSN